MAHSLVRIKGSLTNTPHLIDQNSFNSVMEYVNKRIEGNVDITQKEMASWGDVDGDFSGRYHDDIKTGVMHISGPLTYKTSGWEAFCGGTSYEMLKGQMEYFAEKGAKTVAMLVDSGGGQAHGMMDSANYMRKLADDAGIKIVAYVDGISASAAYGISCIADEIVMSADSQTGSIGVLIQLYNDSKYLEKIGYERTFITAGANKVPWDAEGKFTESFISGLQEQVDTLYEGFTSHVATHRSLSVEAVKATEAGVFMAQQSVELGLADSIMTAEEFHEYLSTYAENNLEGTEMRNLFKLNSQEDTTEMAKLEEMQAALNDKEALLSASQEAVTALGAQLTASAAALTDLTARLEAMEGEKALAKTESRKAALAAQVPADQLDASLAAYAGLDDASFAFMVGQLKTVKDARAANMEELGGEGQDSPAPAVEANATESIRQAGIEAAKAAYGRK